MSVSEKYSFLSAADEWICDDYSLDIRYIAIPGADGPILISASVGFYPLQSKIESSFSIHTPKIWVGQI